MTKDIGNDQRSHRTWWVFICLLAATVAYAHYDINEVFFTGNVIREWWTVFRMLKIAIFAFAFPAMLVLLINSRPASRRYYWVVAGLTVVFTFCIFVIILYIDYFSKILNFDKLSDAGNLSSVASQIAIQLIKPHNVILLACGLVAVALLIRQVRRRTEAAIRRGLIIFCYSSVIAYFSLVGLQVWRFGSPLKTLVNYGGVTTASHYGFIVAYASMIVLDATTPDTATVVAYPGTINKDVPRRSNIPQLKRPNIFMVQVESLDHHVIDLCVGNEQVMPFLHNLKSQCVFCDNCYAHHNGGGSSDAEFATLLSILPIVAHNGNTTALYHNIDALTHILKRNNYFISAFHSNKGHFYHRTEMYSKIGADRFFDADWFTAPAHGWHAQDLAFFEQSFQLLRKHARQPFLAYFITIQSHGPFRNHDDQTTELLHLSEDKFNRVTRDYLASMREVDSALARFFQLLREQYPEGNNLVLIYGDHTSDVIDKSKNGTEEIPLFIVHPSLRSEVINEPVSLIDIAPTVTHLLRIESGKTWQGDTVFTVGPRQAALIDLTRITRINNDVITVKTCDSLLPFRRYSRYLQGEHQ